MIPMRLIGITMVANYHDLGLCDLTGQLLQPFQLMELLILNHVQNDSVFSLVHSWGLSCSFVTA